MMLSKGKAFKVLELKKKETRFKFDEEKMILIDLKYDTYYQFMWNQDKLWGVDDNKGQVVPLEVNELNEKIGA